MGHHTSTHCHCGADRKGSDHCPECGCEEFETVCDHVHQERKLLWEQGNLYTGDPYGVEVRKQFGSSEVHGPFNGDVEAWNYGMNLAIASDGSESFHLVRLALSKEREIASAENVAAYLAGKRLGERVRGERDA